MGRSKFVCLTNTGIMFLNVKKVSFTLALVSSPGVRTGAAIALTGRTFLAFIYIWCKTGRT